MAHDAHHAIGERLHFVRIDRTGTPRFSGERRLAARRRGVLEEARRVRVLRPIARDDDVVETEGEHHAARDLVLPLIAGHRPVPVRPEALVQIAAVEIDQVIALLDDLLGDRERRAIGLRPAGIPRIEPVHALVVDGVDVRRDLLERRDVDDGDEHERARQLHRVDARDQILDRHDRRVLRSV